MARCGLVTESGEQVRLAEYEQIQECVRVSETIRIVGRSTMQSWRVWSTDPKAEMQLEGEPLPTANLVGLVDYSPADQVVTAKAGWPVLELQKVLRAEGQCLPIGDQPFDLSGGSIGGSIAMNLPHFLEGRYGNWRDWVLGLKVVLADGRLVKCGSHAVKNVAGYDVQKLFVGSRGTLGVIVEATLRTYPLVDLAGPSLAEIDPLTKVIQRVRLSDFDRAVASITGPVVSDPSTGTLWFGLPRGEDPIRYAGDWFLRQDCGRRNFEIKDSTQIRLMERAKEIFDPTHKFNRGEFAIF